jgi:hypothetical protein
MHWEKASVLFDAELLGEDDPPADDEPALATPGAFEPLHAAASSTTPAVAMMAAAVRAAGAMARRRLRTDMARSFADRMPPVQRRSPRSALQ